MNYQPAVSPTAAKILALVAQGLSTQDIANQLHMREHEIEDEVSEMLRSLGLHSRVELMLFAYSGPTENERAA